MTSIGVFYDGGWFARVSAYYAGQHPWKSRISPAGLNDALCWHIGASSGDPASSCVMTEAHYVRSRIGIPSPGLDRALEEAGITRHDVDSDPGSREPAVAMYLALQAFDRATASGLDVVALITGDAGLVPLVTRLRGRGIQVFVPTVDAEFLVPRFGTAELHTAGDLRAAASSTAELETLLRAGLAEGYPLRHPLASPARGSGDRAPAARGPASPL